MVTWQSTRFRIDPARGLRPNGPARTIASTPTALQVKIPSSGYCKYGGDGMMQV